MRAGAALSISCLLLILNVGTALAFPSDTLHLSKEIREKAVPPASQEANDSFSQVRVIKKGAVLRLKPKEDAVVIGNLPLGALLDVEEQLDDWLRISLPPDKDGFVVTGYLHRSFIEPSTLIHR
jgi:hypothetical protein